MGLFARQESDDGKLHYILRLAFERIKNDMHNLFHWVNYFHQKHQEHDQRLARLEQHISNAPNANDIKQIIDTHYPYEHILKKIEELHARINVLEAQKLEKEGTKVALKEKLLRKITKNSKEYIKSVIFGVMKKYGRISGPQLKEIIVEEQGICSKSSFYRLLAEIEAEREIGSFADGKEKIYFLKAQITK